MSRLKTVVAMLALCLPHAASAQSENAFVGYFGLVFTPVGAFAPVVTGTLNAGATTKSVQLRVSTWQFDGADDRSTNIGAGLVLGRGRTRTALELGYIRNEQCSECGVLMAGADVQYDLAQSTGTSATLVAVLNPAFGMGIPTEGSGSVFTVRLGVPLSASISTGNSLRIVPFVAPGFGLSLITGSGDAETGYRATLAGGISLGSQSSPMLVSANVRKIFLEGSPTIYGLGVVFAP